MKPTKLFTRILAVAACLAIAPALYAQVEPEPEPEPEETEADMTPPALTITSPEAGAKINGKFTVSGTATDNVGVVIVEYRVEGKKKWQRALMSTSGEVEADATDVVWILEASPRESKYTRVYVRARDRVGNESDTIGRRVRRR